MIYLMRRMDVARCCFALQVPFNDLVLCHIVYFVLCEVLNKGLKITKSAFPLALHL